ncbi:MAG: dockerin type I repeat-containing protein, partial [Clostridia bacterium]|nr:dockerin type I repeat-containing protein [Clostridia bacterium]
TCEVCGEKKTEVITATGHSYSDWTADGDNHKKVCDCGDAVTEPHAWNAGEVTVEPGEYEEGEKVYTCTVCGAERTVTIPALGHTHTMTKVDAVEPTCTEAGNVEYYSCDGCGRNYTTEDGSEQILNVVIPALGHSYNEGEVTKAPTHTEEGEKTYTCEVCGDSYTEAISKTPDHEYVGAVTKAATHTEEGEMTYTCECGESYAESIAKLPDHVWGEGVVTKEPTTEAEGEMTYTCICGEQKTEVIEKLKPTYVPGDVDGNGLIETRDIILVRRYIAGGYGVEINPDAADVDKNGLVETRDIILMRRYIAGGYGVELL